jgi:hypothetical protein
MSELERELFENQLKSIAKRMDNPRTPNIAGSVMTQLRASTRPGFFSRNLAWSLTMIVVLFSSLMLIPPVRAAVVEFIQIGIVRIFPRPIDVISTATPDALIPGTATPSIPAATLIPSLSRIAGETTLADAQSRLDYSILLPAYPSDLGLPDHVFLQDAEGTMTILVWLDPRQINKVLMSLHFIPEGSWGIEKSEPRFIEQANVNGQPAIWAVGPYPLRLRNGNLDFTRLIDGNVLIWADDNLTYRLETNQSLEEAIQIAESLEPIP